MSATALWDRYSSFPPDDQEINNFIMQQVTSHLIDVRQFFFEVAEYSGFFSKSLREPACLIEWWHRLPGAGAVRWNYHSHAVNTVLKHKDDLLQCFENIRDRQV